MKGDNHTLKLGLVSVPVQVCKATDSGGDVTFDSAAPSGGKKVIQYVDEATGEVFEHSETLKGVKVGDEFKVIDAENIKNIGDQTKVTVMEALGEISRDEFDSKYADRVQGRYFLQVPTKGGSGSAYRLVYESLLADKRGIVVKRTPRTRQKLNVIFADENEGCLKMLEVAFDAQVRHADDQVKAALTAKVDAKQIKMARDLIKGLPSGSEVIEAEVDEAVALRNELIEKAIAGESIPAPTPVAQTEATDDLAAQLEASLAAAKA